MPTKIDELWNDQRYASLLKYGEARRWPIFGKKHKSRIRRKVINGNIVISIDGEPIEVIEQQLKQYDESSTFKKFWLRLFTPLERKRTLICYWAATRVTQFMRHDFKKFNVITSPLYGNDVKAVRILASHGYKVTKSILKPAFHHLSFLVSFVRGLFLLRNANMSLNRIPTLSIPPVSAESYRPLPTATSPIINATLDDTDSYTKLNQLLTSNARIINEISTNPTLTPVTRVKAIEDQIAKCKAAYQRLSKPYSKKSGTKVERRNNELVLSHFKDLYNKSIEELSVILRHYKRVLKTPLAYIPDIKHIPPLSSPLNVDKVGSDIEFQFSVFIKAVTKIMGVNRTTKQYPELKEEVRKRLKDYHLSLHGVFKAYNGSCANPVESEKADQLLSHIQSYIAEQMELLIAIDEPTNERVSDIKSLWLPVWQKLHNPISNIMLSNNHERPSDEVRPLPPLTSSLRLVKSSVRPRNFVDAQVGGVQENEVVDALIAKFESDIKELSFKGKALLDSAREALRLPFSEAENAAKSLRDELKALCNWHKKKLANYHPDKTIQILEATTAHSMCLRWMGAFEDIQDRFISIFEKRENSSSYSFSDLNSKYGDLMKRYDDTIISYEELTVKLREALKKQEDLIKRMDDAIVRMDSGIKRNSEGIERNAKGIERNERALCEIRNGIVEERNAIGEMRLDFSEFRAWLEKQKKMTSINSATDHQRFFSPKHITRRHSTPDLTACVTADQLQVDKLVIARSRESTL